MTTLPVFTTDSLARYDGTDPTKPVYLAMDGWVYDVSPGREEFYQPGKPYHDLVGKDSTAMLRVAGGEIIKRKYAVVGQYRAE
jgi:predicted heme/steroid binding protein